MQRVDYVQSDGKTDGTTARLVRFALVWVLIALVEFVLVFPRLHAAEADLIVRHGKIVTVDPAFSIHAALAVKDGKIAAVGTDAEMADWRGAQTEEVDLRGALVLPGLIDSHVHPASAAMTEFDHPIPAMETIDDVLNYIRQRAKTLPAGQWIEVRQVFITRLLEQRYPSRAELDAAAPEHPVIFQTGPDAALNSLAMRISGIDKDFKVTDGGSGFVEKDPKTGEPTGLLRNCTRFVKVVSPRKQPTDQDKLSRLAELFADYNAVGLTAVCDRNAGVGDVELYQQLRRAGKCSVRLALSRDMPSLGSLDQIRDRIKDVAGHALARGDDDLVRIIGIKMFLDGGMLTGSAYMRQPWGVSKIYGITDADYRGVLFIPPDRLREMVRATLENGLQFTAHSVGDGAVHTLLDVYQELAKEGLVRPGLACISHSNFMSREAAEQAALLGVVLDIQPAWLYLDTRTLAQHFGYERLRYFQPLGTLFAAGANAGGGSDHMQKIGADRAINLYNPFLGMAITLQRHGKGYARALHPEEALTREQAIRFYTINNARTIRMDDRIGSLEPGKLADFVVVDTDLLTCPVELVAKTKVRETYLSGRRVYPRKEP